MNNLLFSVMLIATLILFNSSITTPTPIAASPAPSPILSGLRCNEKCGRRCANAGYKERCLKYCGICCGKCEGCVPSSPYADKAECPCYRDLKNSKGKDKCP